MKNPIIWFICIPSRQHIPLSLLQELQSSEMEEKEKPFHLKLSVVDIYLINCDSGFVFQCKWKGYQIKHSISISN